MACAVTTAAAGAALHAFLDRLIDYAGLYPPARLDLAPAVDEYLRHLGEPGSFMLGRFVVDAARFSRLIERVEAVGHAGPLRVAVLAGGGEHEREALHRMRAEAAEMRDLMERHPGAGVVEVVETKLPRETLEASDPERTRDFVEDFRAVLAGAGLGAVPAFFEVAATDRWYESDRDAARGLEDAGESPASPPSGFKLRCGGPGPSDVPPAGRIAFVIAECRDRGVPLKCTAGLHRPLRHGAGGSGAEGHGFLNVFAAAVLASARQLEVDAIETCVLDGDSASFRFEDDALSWRSFRASAAEVERARRVLATGFGSCSFDEPRRELRDLGIPI